MTEQGVEATARPAAAALVEAGWGALMDRLLGGLCHDVNGRLVALHGASYFVELGEPLPPGFADEVTRLEGVAERMQLLIGDVDAAPVAYQGGELLGRVRKLHAGLKDLDEPDLEIPIPSGLPSLLVNEARSLRLLLLFAEAAHRSTGASARRLDVRATPDGLFLAFTPEDPQGIEGALGALDDVATLDGGSVSLEGERCVLALPSLARSRAERG